MVSVDGIRLRCLDVGTARVAGDAVVLLHGFGLSLFGWRHVVPLLAESIRVVAVDRPGFGGSDRPDPGRGSLAPAYTAVGSAALVLGALSTMGVRRAVLVGHSAGAGAAIAASTHPGVAGIVLVAPVLGGAPSPIGLLARLPGSSVVAPALLRAVGPAAARTVLRRTWHEPLDRATEAGLLELFSTPGWEQPLWAMSRHQEAVHAGVDPRTVQVPALVVGCSKDRIAPLGGVSRLAAALPDAQLVRLTGCGHLPHETHPAELADLVASFVRTVGLTA